MPLKVVILNLCTLVSLSKYLILYSVCVVCIGFNIRIWQILLASFDQQFGLMMKQSRYII